MAGWLIFHTHQIYLYFAFTLHFRPLPLVISLQRFFKYFRCFVETLISQFHDFRSTKLLKCYCFLMYTFFNNFYIFRLVGLSFFVVAPTSAICRLKLASSSVESYNLAANERNRWQLANQAHHLSRENDNQINPCIHNYLSVMWERFWERLSYGMRLFLRGGLIRRGETNGHKKWKTNHLEGYQRKWKLLQYLV